MSKKVSSHIEITLTEFIDYTFKVSTQRLTLMRNIVSNRNDPYDPQKDYYKRFRDAVVEIHKSGLPLSGLKNLVNEVPAKKRNGYTAIIDGYIKFIGKKKVVWNDPTKSAWIEDDLLVNVNPELRLEIGEKKYLIKFYLKGAPSLNKDRASLILCLLHNQFGGKIEQDEIICLLDVRNSKPFIFEPSMSSFLPLLKSEATSFAKLYRSLIS